MSPNTIKESGKVIKGGKLIATVFCCISTSKEKSSWGGYLKIEDTYSPMASMLVELGKLNLKLENYQGEIRIKQMDLKKGPNKVNFTGVGELKKI